jgi:hypothetical protein
MFDCLAGAVIAFVALAIGVLIGVFVALAGGLLIGHFL